MIDASPNPPRYLTVLAISALAWTTICAMGALSSYADWQRDGSDRPYWQALWAWCFTHLLLMLYTCQLYVVFSCRPALLADVRRIGAAYALVVTCFVPLEMLYSAFVRLVQKHEPLSVAGLWQRLQRIDRYDWFMEFAWTSFTFIAVVAICTWSVKRRTEQQWQHLQVDHLRLQLDLEYQRLQALRGQLEPHFIFNALNAITALVRSDDRRAALTGISRLSALLRYALVASERDWVRVDEELAFVRDYLSLQRLRYGERLQIRIEGDAGPVLEACCPPLLLQPLIENALRHDLDCHGGCGDVRLALRCEAAEVVIRMCNPLHAGGAFNPGLGLGLRSTRARLQLAYGERASLRTWEEAGRFVAEVRLDAEADEVAS
ncbi:sensor histidine kinase [Pseudoduganella plicata]|uniref:Sensor histidine kinase n=2 Tax=Pseudoduganella plicata TaxID=321984 RepID=A0ABX5SGA1_9BURK|nr:sensor histidine kinase [Pseudoduganella plicata]